MPTNEANETKLAQPSEPEVGSSRRSLDITDDTYRQAKALAAIHGETISQFFETAALVRIATLRSPQSEKTNTTTEKTEASVRDVRHLLCKS